MRGLSRHLNRTLEVWRLVSTPDGHGGQDTEFVQQGAVRAKVDQPSATEQIIAAQGQSEHSHNIYLAPTADVRRGDQLRGTDARGYGQVFRVLSVIQPSTPVYSKALAELIQTEGDP